jgi:putative ABC transport system permease protein/lipoprotein-releasing system permease protein
MANGRELRPLAPSVYLLRNLGKTGPLMGVIVMAVLLITGIVTLIDSIPMSIRTTYGYSKLMLGVGPRGDPRMPPKLRQILTTDPPVEVERVSTCRVSSATVRSIVGKWPFAVIGLAPDDMRHLLNRMGVNRIDGRLPAKGAPEAIVSTPVAKNLGLEIGSVLLSPEDVDRYSPFDVKVVGIARTDHWLMLNDIDYQRAYHFPPVDGLLAFAEDVTRQPVLDAWAEDRLKGMRAQVFSYGRLEKDTVEMFAILYTILNIVIGTVVITIGIMMGLLMHIYQSHRLVEFGLLQAIGYTRRGLVLRALRETTIVVVGGWLLGVLIAFSLLTLAKSLLMDPNAFALDRLDPAAYAYTVTVPACVFAAGILAVLFRFRRFDPVAVIERRIV